MTQNTTFSSLNTQPLRQAIILASHNIMNYIEAGLTREDREQQHKDMRGLLPYIKAIKLKEHGCIKREMCGLETNEVDCHHKTYKKDLTYYDLQLLCIPCHTSITDYSRIGI